MYIAMRKIILLIPFFYTASLIAQNLLPATTILVNQYGKELNNAWAGGFNNPEFSAINLNRDGFKDLYIFDKDGFVSSTFINMGKPDTPMFIYAPKYHKNFPPMQRLALLRDYNNDGVEDIYTSAVAGLKLYKGNYIGGTNFTYTLIDSPLTFITSGFEVNLYNANDDIPAIRDIDNDGDLDILVNSIFGMSYEFYKNKSVENTGSPDTSIFELASTCWGHFHEDALNNKLIFGACKTDEYIPVEPAGSYRHAGCTIEMFDQNNDTDLELILGDPNFQTLVYGENSGSISDASITYQDTTFPSYNRTIRLSLFPASYYIDVNNDSYNDLLIAPNISAGSNNVGNVWYYKNTKNVSNVQFNYVQDSFLIGEMIDVGANSKPLCFDFNSDGLLDILVANTGYYNNTNGNIDSKISLYQHVGTIDSPAFKLITHDYSSLFSLGIKDMKPSVGDIDNDGDIDILLGDADGFLHLFFNNPAGGIANFSLTPPIINLGNIDAGTKANPYFFDIDNDTDLDILVGRSDGGISFYKNFGTSSTFMFHKDSVNRNFGNINVTNIFSHPDGNASVFVRDTILYVGCQEGYIQTFLINNDSLFAGSFVKQNSRFGMIRDGFNSTLFICDLNNDAQLEYICGNSRGGLTMYSTADWDTIIAPKYVLSVSESAASTISCNVYPNPTSDIVYIDLPDFVSIKNWKMFVYDIHGKLIYTNSELYKQNTITCKTWDSGVYFIRIVNELGSITKKMIRY